VSAKDKKTRRTEDAPWGQKETAKHPQKKRQKQEREREKGQSWV